jgi:hypothetical protein
VESTWTLASPIVPGLARSASASRFAPFPSYARPVTFRHGVRADEGGHARMPRPSEAHRRERSFRRWLSRSNWMPIPAGPSGPTGPAGPTGTTRTDWADGTVVPVFVSFAVAARELDTSIEHIEALAKRRVLDLLTAGQAKTSVKRLDDATATIMSGPPPVLAGCARAGWPAGNHRRSSVGAVQRSSSPTCRRVVVALSVASVAGARADRRGPSRGSRREG